MNEAKQQLLDRLKSANNILVTVSRNPSVDQLSALLGLTLLLNKQGKHAAAVFSGEVPSTLEFLQPDETIEKNTDSLRDFIIALDKAKADKLRYKVEDDIVRIFITPYKTSISEKDFEFSQGDFNVDVVIGLGVSSQEDLDEAITAHGRILHDATLTSINITQDGGLGSINWHEPTASSLSELITTLAQDLEGAVLDEQISTALMTGIVAETNRFSNEKTSSQTMSVSAILMAAGANQQLVASELEVPKLAADGETHDLPVDQNDDSDDSDESDDSKEPEESTSDGTLEIEHNSEDDEAESEESQTEDAPVIELPSPDEDENAENNSDEADPAKDESSDESDSVVSSGSKLVTEPPLMGGTLTANSSGEKLDPTTDPLTVQDFEPQQMLDHKREPLPALLPSEQSADSESQPAPGPAIEFNQDNSGFTPPPPAWTPPNPQEPATPNPSTDASTDAAPTLSDLEAAVQEAAVVPEVEQGAQLSDEPDQPMSQTASDDEEPLPGDLNTARDEVSRALNSSADLTAPQPPIQALNAQPIDLNPVPPAQNNQLPAELDPSLLSSDPGPAPTPAYEPPNIDTPAQVTDPNAPPPVPPPIPFQFGNPPSQQ